MDILVVVIVVVVAAVLVVGAGTVVEDTGRDTGSLDTVVVEDMDTGRDSMGMVAVAVVAGLVAVEELSVAVLAASAVGTSSTASL